MDPILYASLAGLALAVLYIMWLLWTRAEARNDADAFKEARDAQEAYIRELRMELGKRVGK